MKKLTILLALIMSMSFTVNGATLEEATSKLAEKLNIKITEDVSSLKYIHNRETIENKNLFASVMSSGWLIPSDHIIKASSTDYSPLINGIISKTISDGGMKILTSNISDMENKSHVSITDNTFFLTENLARKDINYNEEYTYVVDMKNEVKYIWVTGGIKHPVIYKANLFWVEGKTLIVKNLKTRSFMNWVPVNSEEYTEFNLENNVLNEEFILKNIDKEIYVFVDDYGSEIKVLKVESVK